MKQIAARCLLCGKTYDVEEGHGDFKKLKEQPKETPTFICDYCRNKVRYESDEKRKEKKPL